MERIRPLLRKTTLLFLSISILMPVVWFVFTGFVKREAVLHSFPRLHDLTLDHFIAIFNRFHIAKCLPDTMTLSISSSFLALGLAVPCAYFVSRDKGRVPYNVYSLSLAMWLVPPIAFSLQIYFWFNKIGFYDNLLSLILLLGMLHSTLGILLLTPFLDKIPRHIDE